jgi:SNF2 family DNA or RNA helicase
MSGTPISTSIDELMNQFAFFDIPLLSTPRTLNMLRTHIFGKGGVELNETCTPRDACALLLCMLTRSMIRHKKCQSFDGRSELVSLPPRTLETIKVNFKPDEQLAYNNLYAFARTRFFELSKHHSLVSKMALLTPLRQACSYGHRDLNDILIQLRAIAAAEQAEHAAAQAANEAQVARFEESRAFNDDTVECSICLDAFDDPVMTPCRHVYCRACIHAYISSANGHECPLCRKQFSKKQLQEPPKPPAPIETKESAAAVAAANAAEVPASIVFSSKVDALMTQIHLLRNDQPKVKALVFSQFTQTINAAADRYDSHKLTHIGGITLNSI